MSLTQRQCIYHGPCSPTPFASLLQTKSPQYAQPLLQDKTPGHCPSWFLLPFGSPTSKVTLARQWPGDRQGPLAPQPGFPTLPLTSTQCRDIANNHRELRRLGITHVLNASHSRWRGPPEAYEGLGIRYLGVEAHDSPAFDMSIHFQTAADFIHRALSQPGGRRGQQVVGKGQGPPGPGESPGLECGGGRDFNDSTQCSGHNVTVRKEKHPLNHFKIHEIRTRHKKLRRK